MAPQKEHCSEIDRRKFRCDYRQRRDVSKPGGFTSIQKIDKCSVEPAHGYGKEQIAK
jgi:hypothetical protein